MILRPYDHRTPLISKKVAATINAQIGLEFLASLQYEAIAAWFKLEGLPRLQAHFSRQAEEERDHAHRFIKNLLDAGMGLEQPVIPAPKCKFRSATERCFAIAGRPPQAIQRRAGLSCTSEVRVSQTIQPHAGSRSQSQCGWEQPRLTRET